MFWRGLCFVSSLSAAFIPQNRLFLSKEKDYVRKVVSVFQMTPLHCDPVIQGIYFSGASWRFTLLFPEATLWQNNQMRTSVYTTFKFYISIQIISVNNLNDKILIVIYNTPKLILP